MSDPFGLNESRQDLPTIPDTRWVGRVATIVMERGIMQNGPRKGTPYLLYKIRGRDNRLFQTFSRTFGETAHQGIVKNWDVQVDHPGGHSSEIKAISIVEPEEKQNDDDA